MRSLFFKCPITILLGLLCCGLFFSGVASLNHSGKALLFDYPRFVELQDEVASAHVPMNMRQRLFETPFWCGLYTYFFEGSSTVAPGSIDPSTLCEKIREGQVWRLFSPIALHANLLHLLFNMSWIVALGKIIESRLGPFRYLLLILLIALFSNVAQYLMTGYFFMGISGVVCGFIGFIAARRKQAPWEGYELSSASIHGFMFFIIILTILSICADIAQKLFGFHSFIAFANSAHIVGFLMGWFFGQLRYFRVFLQRT